jgi:hypothetical protein
VVAFVGDAAQLHMHRRWLARSRLERRVPGELLPQVLSALGIAPPFEGLGALRLWGQMGERPTGWVAAADPVYMEARLDHLVLHALPPSELPEADVSEIFGYLQGVLGVDGSSAFSSVGRFGYLHRDRPMTTASAAPSVAQGDAPGDYMPSGAKAKPHDRLQGEVQMCLYESAVNERRARAGRRPINALWLWGGGVASSSSASLPQLYADDPLMTGYWLSAAAPASPWPANLEACLRASPDGFVAVVPDERDAGRNTTGDALTVLRRMMQRGRLRSLTLLFRDGLRADVARWDALRFWRRSDVLAEAGRR